MDNTTSTNLLTVVGFWQSQEDQAIFSVLSDGRIFHIDRGGYIHLQSKPLPQDCLQLKWNDPQLTDERCKILSRTIENFNTGATRRIT